MIHTREALTAQAKLHRDSFQPPMVTIELAKGDKAWNPERNDTLLRGPGRVTYVFWSDQDVDHAFHAAVGA